MSSTNWRWVNLPLLSPCCSLITYISSSVNYRWSLLLFIIISIYHYSVIVITYLFTMLNTIYLSLFMFWCLLLVLIVIVLHWLLLIVQLLHIYCEESLWTVLWLLWLGLLNRKFSFQGYFLILSQLITKIVLDSLCSSMLLLHICATAASRPRFGSH